MAGTYYSKNPICAVLGNQFILRSGLKVEGSTPPQIKDASNSSIRNNVSTLKKEATLPREVGP
jgi:hypothetical protein